jgi:hypothetical protein
MKSHHRLQAETTASLARSHSSVADWGSVFASARPHPTRIAVSARGHFTPLARPNADASMVQADSSPFAH